MYDTNSNNIYINYTRDTYVNRLIMKDSKKYIKLKGPSLFSSEHWLKCTTHNIPFPKGSECPACASLDDQTHDYEGDIGMKCNFCGHPLEKVGAEISAPPSKRLVEILGLSEDTEVCRRFRMCESCYNDVIVKNLVKDK